ncbi:hypothetical protein GCM10022289_18420 [Pedobacter jeongneungensis]|uniref:Uncharacterized protein n=1 Tax=Pedobacter jeongneungensis TaxID=947309 RepID=A0ABP8BCA7_9SPHI
MEIVWFGVKTFYLKQIKGKHYKYLIDKIGRFFFQPVPDEAILCQSRLLYLEIIKRNSFKNDCIHIQERGIIFQDTAKIPKQ